MRRIGSLFIAILLCSVFVPAPSPGTPSMRALVHAKVKHVFVIVQENHTFDQYFGLYPGMDGEQVANLGSALAKRTDCLADPMAGSGRCQRPFLISAASGPNYVADAADSVGGNNSRVAQDSGIDGGKMDRFLADREYGQEPLPKGATPSEIGAWTQRHNTALTIVSLYDCNTIPYLWYYAQHFALFDHYFQGDTGPSSPGNLQLFAGQMGQTEAAARILNVPGYRDVAVTATIADGDDGFTPGVPMSNDDNPPPSQLPFVTYRSKGTAQEWQSYASMPVLLNPAMDLAARDSGIVGRIGADISLESKSGRPSIPWRWYSEGLYSHAGFSAHHMAPLYFDYINHRRSAFADTTTLRDNSESDGLISDVRSGKLPTQGVFWVKGGGRNGYGLAPADPVFSNNATGRVYYAGDDDHPGKSDSDHQVAEAYVAKLVDAIARSKYWKDSVIIITWDDSGGYYDHLPPPAFGATCPQDESLPRRVRRACGDGVRLPALLISPFSKTGRVVHDLSDHGSVSKFIEAVFALPAFASLPDESAGRSIGLEPLDADSATSDLTGALDIRKLDGSVPPNPPLVAEIPDPSVPANMSCATLRIAPLPAPAPIPKGFETAGWYLHRELLRGASTSLLLPANDHDDGD